MTPQAVKEEMQYEIKAHGQGVDSAMDTIAQVIDKCETGMAMEQDKQLKPLWYEGECLKYKWGGLADRLYHAPTNLPRPAPYAYNGRSKHQMAGNISHAPCH